MHALIISELDRQAAEHKARRARMASAGRLLVAKENARIEAERKSEAQARMEAQERELVAYSESIAKQLATPEAQKIIHAVNATTFSRVLLIQKEVATAVDLTVLQLLAKRKMQALFDAGKIPQVLLDTIPKPEQEDTSQ